MSLLHEMFLLKFRIGCERFICRFSMKCFFLNLESVAKGLYISCVGYRFKKCQVAYVMQWSSCCHVVPMTKNF
jgi:hypothetical protein